MRSNHEVVGSAEYGFDGRFLAALVGAIVIFTLIFAAGSVTYVAIRDFETGEARLIQKFILVDAVALIALAVLSCFWSTEVARCKAVSELRGPVGLSSVRQLITWSRFTWVMLILITALVIVSPAAVKEVAVELEISNWGWLLFLFLTVHLANVLTIIVSRLFVFSFKSSSN